MGIQLDKPLERRKTMKNRVVTESLGLLSTGRAAKASRKALWLLAAITLSGTAACDDSSPNDELPPVESKPAPLPEAARGPAIDSAKGYLVEEIKDGLYYMTDGVYQNMFLTTGQGVIVVDAPPSYQGKLTRAIAEVTGEPITHLIYSHSHADHIGGAGALPPGITIIAHEETNLQLARANDPNRPLASETFTDTFTLDVGTQHLELAYKGPQHEPGNIYIYAPGQKTLMVVDIIFPGWTPFKSLAIAEDAPSFVAAHDDILAYDFDVLIGGHLTRRGTRADVEIQKEYITDIRNNALMSLQTVDFNAIGQKVGFDNPWALFSAYLDEVADRCAAATVPKWIDRLGAVDIFTRTHCAVFGDSLRVD